MAEQNDPNQPPQEPGENSARDRFFAFLRGRPMPVPPGTPETPERSYACQPPDNPMEDAFLQALDGLHPYCPKCGELCEAHAPLVRDRMMQRFGILCAQGLQAVKAYFTCRELGIDEPVDVIGVVYATWDEIVDLGESSDPTEVYRDGPEAEAGDEEEAEGTDPEAGEDR